MTSPVPGAMIGGKYRLERPLAHGGMGSVWRAWQAGLERPVAIKFMAAELISSPIAWQRFDREAKAAGQLRTPHVVQIHDHGVEGSLPYIVMELLEGEDLGARLKRVGRMSLADTQRLLTQASKALRRAHEAGIVHRDLKPANVFLARSDDEEIVKILDFGIARAGGVTESTSHDAAAAAQVPAQVDATKTGLLIGSPHYMSPEQARAERAVDHRSDLWSMGVILYRALTGVLPFPGDEVGPIIYRVVNDPLPPPTRTAPDLPPEIDRFFERALAKDPAQRFTSAPEMATALATITEMKAPRATPAPRTSYALAGAGVMAVIGAAAVVWVVRATPAPAAPAVPVSAATVTAEPSATATTAVTATATPTPSVTASATASAPEATAKPATTKGTGKKRHNFGY